MVQTIDPLPLDRASRRVTSSIGHERHVVCLLARGARTAVHNISGQIFILVDQNLNTSKRKKKRKREKGKEGKGKKKKEKGYIQGIFH